MVGKEITTEFRIRNSRDAFVTIIHLLYSLEDKRRKTFRAEGILGIASYFLAVTPRAEGSLDMVT